MSLEASMMRLARHFMPAFVGASHVEPIPDDSKQGGDLILRRLFALIANTEARPHTRMLLLCKTRFSSDESFAVARREIEADPEMKSLIHTQTHLRRLTNRSTGMSLQFATEDYVRGS